MTECFLPKIRDKKRMSVKFFFFLIILLEFLGQFGKKKWKVLRWGNKVIFSNDLILYLENLEEFTHIQKSSFYFIFSI